MPIDHKKKIVFIHIPKTAGTSIEIAMGINKHIGKDGKNLLNRSINDFSSHSLYGRGMQHFQIQEIYSHLESLDKDINSYKYFTVIRNPGERLISHYLGRNGNWLKIQNFNKKSYLSCLIFLIHISLARIMIEGTSNKRFRRLKRIIYCQYEHIVSQYKYICQNKTYTIIFNFDRLNEMEDFLLENGYQKLYKYRQNKSKPSAKIIKILSLYARIFYKKDWEIYQNN